MQPFLVASSVLNIIGDLFFVAVLRWGSMGCAAGYSGAVMNADKVNLSIGGVRLVENGMNCNIPLTSLTDIMSEHDITMTIDMAAGNECATVWTCDFSYEYVKINGEYHT